MNSYVVSFTAISDTASITIVSANVFSFTVGAVSILRQDGELEGFYAAQVLSAQEYFAFGGMEPGRNYNSTDYATKLEQIYERVLSER